MKKRNNILAILLAIAVISNQASFDVYAAQQSELLVEESTELMDSEENEESSIEEETDSEETTTDENENIELNSDGESDTTTTEGIDPSLDSDNDGITDVEEIEFGTDPYSADTDEDGLTDYEEIFVITSAYVDALMADSTGDGIIDSLKDCDGDGLTNRQELDLGTNPIEADTDSDGLNDGDELNVFNTNPLLPDTDGDGATDGWEIKNGFNPTITERAFKMSITSEDGAVTLDFTAEGFVAENTTVVASDTTIDTNEEVQSYSKVYEINAPEKGFVLATLTFNKSVKKIDKPLIYRYDAENETDKMTSCITKVKKNLATAKIVTTGKYVLKSLAEVEDAEQDNKDSVEDSKVDVVENETNSTGDTLLDMCPEGAKDFNHDGISDEYTKLLVNGDILTGDYRKVFGLMTYKEVQSSDDADADSLLNGQEIQLYLSKDGLVYAVLSSSPIALDTDNDGIYDADDTAPLEYGLAGGVVGSLRIVGKHDFSCIETEGHSFLVYTSYVDNYEFKMDNLYAYYLLNKDYADTLAADETLYSWRTVSSSTTTETDSIRKEAADALYSYTNLEDKNATTSFVLNRGDDIAIGNFTQKTYADSVCDAILNSPVGTKLEIETIKILYSAFTGEEVSMAYVLAHYGKIMGDALFRTYIFGTDTLTGITDGGIWVNREMYDQKCQYDQFPNQIYERDLTVTNVNDLCQFLADNSYYNIFSHNCSSVASGAWNHLFGYERDTNGNLILENGSYVKNMYYLNARGEGIFAIIDLPMMVSNSIKALGAKDASGHVTKDGPLIIVKGCDVTNTVNNNVNKYIFSDGQITINPEYTPTASVISAGASVIKATTAIAAQSSSNKNKTRSASTNSIVIAENSEENAADAITEDTNPEEVELISDGEVPLSIENSTETNPWIFVLAALIFATLAVIAAYCVKKKNTSK